MENTWIVVPVIANDVDLSSFVDNLSGGFVAPETFEKSVYDPETKTFKTQEIAHPYAGQTGHDFSNRIIFVNAVPGYTEYDGVVHIEDFGDLNIYRSSNVGIEHAVANGADFVFVLNGAINLDTFVINDARNAVSASGKSLINVADGAMFLISAASSHRLDEQFRIWFGDNDLYRRVKDDTGYSRSEFCKLNYLIDTNSVESFDSIVASDEAKYNAKWN